MTQQPIAYFMQYRMIYLISVSMCLVEKLIKMDPVFEELLSVLILQGFLFMQKIMLEKQPRPGTVITLKNHGSHLNTVQFHRNCVTPQNSHTRSLDGLNGF